MKIIVGTTVSKNEDLKFIKKNYKLFSKSIFDFEFIVNTNIIGSLNLHNIKKISKVGDLVESRKHLLKEMENHKADIYFLLDSDIELCSVNDIMEIARYKQNFDLINLVYTGDFTLPAFYTLASSLNDFYNCKTQSNIWEINIRQDDSNSNNSNFMSYSNFSSTKNIESISSGISYSRKITSDVNAINPKGKTSGGATVYFNQNAIMSNVIDKWPKFNKKSARWYDTARIIEISKKFRYKKVPIFVKHNRYSKTVGLSWDEVIRHLIGKNIIEKHQNCKANILHLIQLNFYQKGMLKKIKKLKIKERETEYFSSLEKFLNHNINYVLNSVKEYCNHE